MASPTPPPSVTVESCRARALAIARMFDTWHLQPSDWYIADLSMLPLQGYQVPGLEKEPEARCIVHVDARKLGFGQGGLGPIAPPPGTPEHEAYALLVREGEVSLELVPFERHAIPITFRKMMDVEGHSLWVASLRALGRIWLNDMIEAMSREGGARPGEIARLQASVPQLAALSGVAWPSRDAWFGRFCEELSTLVSAFREVGEPHAARLSRLGRKHALL